MGTVKETQRPHEDWNRFVGVDAPTPSEFTRPGCANPECGNLAQHWHHAWTRKQLAGAYPWVQDTSTGERILNVYPVCPRCHNELHGVGRGRARLFWDNSEMRWHQRIDGVWHDVGPLSVGTFRPGSLPSSPDGPGANTERDAVSLGRKAHRAGPITVGRRPSQSFGAGHGVQREAGTIRVGVVETPGPEVPEGATCPTCRRRRPHERKPSSPKTTKQLNLGTAPADFVDEFKTRLDTLAEQVGIAELPHHRLKVVDVGLELAEHVSPDVWRSIIDGRPWAA